MADCGSRSDPRRPADGVAHVRAAQPVGRNRVEPSGDDRAPSPASVDMTSTRDAADALAVSELSHVTEEARVFMALGHNDRAIEVLHDHIRRLPRSTPAAWLMLLDLYHATGKRPEFRKLADDFHAQFNVQAPSWEAFAAQPVRERRPRRLSSRRAAGGGAVAQARMPRLPRASPPRQSRGTAHRLPAIDVRGHPPVAAGPGRAGGGRHRRRSCRRRQVRSEATGDSRRRRYAGTRAEADAARALGFAPDATAHPLRDRAAGRRKPEKAVGARRLLPPRARSRGRGFRARAHPSRAGSRGAPSRPLSDRASP